MTKNISQLDYSDSSDLYRQMESSSASFLEHWCHLDLASSRYFDESQMVFDNNKQVFHTDNVNECVTAILYNNKKEMFAVHSNPASIPDFNKIVNENFFDKGNLKVIFVGGSEENRELSEKNLSCCVESLKKFSQESGREVEIQDAAIGKGAKSIVFGYGNSGMSVHKLAEGEIGKGEDYDMMHSWNMLRNSCCFQDKEKYGWKPENNIAIWAYKAANKAGPEMPKAQIPNDFMRAATRSYGELSDEEKEILRGGDDKREILNKFHKNITGSDVRSGSHDEKLSLDIFRAVESDKIGNKSSANPNKNPNWQEVRDGRISALGNRIEGLERQNKDGTLAGLDREIYQLYAMADDLGKMDELINYENHKIIGQEVKRPEATAGKEWEKSNGFMIGKAVFGKSDLGEESKFWIFKNPGETRMKQGRTEDKYVYRSKFEESDERSEETNLFNIRYSKGFLEVYSLAEVLLPDNIPEFGVSPRLKYPDQFAIATRFVEGGKEVNAIPQDEEQKRQYKNLRLVGSVIGVDDLIFSNFLVGEDNNLKVIDGINPIAIGRERRGFFSLLERNFLDHQSFVGGRKGGKEIFAELLKDNPFIKPTLGDLKGLREEMEENKGKMESHFDKVRQYNVDGESYESYVQSNIEDLNEFVKFMENLGKECEHCISRKDISSYRRSFIHKRPEAPKASPISQSAEQALNSDEKSRGGSEGASH